MQRLSGGLRRMRGQEVSGGVRTVLLRKTGVCTEALACPISERMDISLPSHAVALRARCEHHRLAASPLDRCPFADEATSQGWCQNTVRAGEPCQLLCLAAHAKSPRCDSEAR